MRKLGSSTMLLLFWFAALFLTLPALEPASWASEQHQAHSGENQGATHTADGLTSDHHANDDHGAAEHNGHHGHEDLGPILPLWSCIPFACMLLSIALFH